MITISSLRDAKHLRAWVWTLITAATLWGTSRAWVHGWEIARLPGRVDQLEDYRARHEAGEADKARVMERLVAAQEEILTELRKKGRR